MGIAASTLKIKYSKLSLAPIPPPKAKSLKHYSI